MIGRPHLQPTGVDRRRTHWITVILGAAIVGLSLGRLLEALDFDGAGTTVGIVAGLALVVGHVSGIRARAWELWSPVLPRGRARV